jgi:hypothetical protein
VLGHERESAVILRWNEEYGKARAARGCRSQHKGARHDELAAASRRGQSIWLDFPRRGLITSGGLERLAREDAVSGVTSKPIIFGRGSLAMEQRAS